MSGTVRASAKGSTKLGNGTGNYIGKINASLRLNPFRPAALLRENQLRTDRFYRGARQLSGTTLRCIVSACPDRTRHQGINTGFFLVR